MSRLFISGRAARVWLLGMAYIPDNDIFEIDSIQELHPECVSEARRACACACACACAPRVRKRGERGVRVHVHVHCSVCFAPRLLGLAADAA